ncbi:MAG: hypothetical protein U0350_08450 [Caldilineaceae bacterium]
MISYLFRTHDPRLYEVILHKSRYHRHIWVQHGSDVEAIQATIEAPDLITADVDDEYKESYYAQGIISDFPDLYLKVCVLFKQDVGRVITAFAVDFPKLEEDVLWQK